MEKSQENLVEWCLEKAEEYLESAKSNIEEDRLYPTAEDIFRVIETTFEAMLYAQGIKEITYPGKERPFKGRLALQFLIRDYLLQKNKITRKLFDKYLRVEEKLHSAGYIYGKSFEKQELKEYLKFAEDLLFKARSMQLKPE